MAAILSRPQWVKYGKDLTEVHYPITIDWRKTDGIVPIYGIGYLQYIGIGDTIV